MTIKEIREAKHLTQQQVANAVGITSTAFARIERGEARIEDCKYSTVMKLIDVLGNEILGGTKMKKEEIRSKLEGLNISFEEKHLSDYNADVSTCIVNGQRCNLYRYAVKNGASYVETSFTKAAVDSFVELCHNVSKDCYVFEELDESQIVVKKWGCIPNIDLENIQGHKVYNGSLEISDILGIEEDGFVIKDKETEAKIRYVSGDTIMFPEVSGKITVRWEANWMMCLIHIVDDNDEFDEIKLYSEINDNIDDEENARFFINGEFDVNAFDEYAYPILKQEIIKQAEKNGIPVDILKFRWD